MMPSAQGRALERLGFLRFTPAHTAGGSFREWLHFAVHDSRVDVLVNLSIVRSPHDLAGKVLVLVRGPDGVWDGDLESFPLDRLDVGAGRLRLQVGPSSVDFDGGVLRVSARCERRDVQVNLTLEPQCFPCLLQNFSLASDAPMSWVVAPRLAASGRVQWGGLTVDLDDATAYHDHNWGHFAGDDLSWEWSCTLATEQSPWNVVTVRVTDGARMRAIAQGVLTWESGSRRTAFRGAQVRFVRDGMRRPESPLRVPRCLSLLVPAHATAVPERIEVAAANGSDWLVGAIDTIDLARIVVPRDVDTGITVLKEVAGRASFRGRIVGRDVTVAGPAFLEIAGPTP
jgi:hypothetical protein